MLKELTLVTLLVTLSAGLGLGFVWPIVHTIAATLSTVITILCGISSIHSGSGIITDGRDYSKNYDIVLLPSAFVGALCLGFQFPWIHSAVSMIASACLLYTAYALFAESKLSKEQISAAENNL